MLEKSKEEKVNKKKKGIVKKSKSSKYELIKTFGQCGRAVVSIYKELKKGKLEMDIRRHYLGKCTAVGIRLNEDEFLGTLITLPESIDAMFPGNAKKIRKKIITLLSE